MPSCTFCARKPVGSYAFTALNGQPDDPASWRRVVAPVCKSCHTALAEDGAGGRVLKATGERWWLGHGQGKFAAPGDSMTGQVERA